MVAVLELFPSEMHLRHTETRQNRFPLAGASLTGITPPQGGQILASFFQRLAFTDRKKGAEKSLSPLFKPYHLESVNVPPSTLI